jgi:hypothetical protein
MPKKRSKSPADSATKRSKPIYSNVHSKIEAASSDVWAIITKAPGTYHTDVVEYTTENTPSDMTNVILAGMPSVLKDELDKPSADMDSIADKALSKTDKHLTAQPGDRGTYLVWARPKANHQTKLTLNPGTTFRQTKLSFALPATMIAGRRRSPSPHSRRKAKALLYSGKGSSGTGGLVGRRRDHGRAETTMLLHRMIKDRDLEAVAFTSWKDTEDSPPVVHTLIETIFMVAFGLFHEKTVSPHTIRNQLMATPNYGSFPVDQNYVPANEKASLNDVEGKYDTYAESMLQARQYDVMNRSRRVRTDAEEERFQDRNAALDVIGDDSVCPVEHCTTVLVPRSRTWHTRLKQWICLACNTRDGNPVKDPARNATINYGNQKVKGPMPSVCTTVWCTEQLKYYTSGASRRASFSWKEGHGWSCHICYQVLSLDQVRENRPTLATSCMACGRTQTRRYSWVAKLWQ